MILENNISTFAGPLLVFLHFFLVSDIFKIDFYTASTKTLTYYADLTDVFSKNTTRFQDATCKL
jgi:hypothetical protein